jgi:hypothetical protein
VKTAETLRDESNQKYFMSGYAAGKRDALEKPVTVHANEMAQKICDLIREQGQGKLDIDSGPEIIESEPNVVAFSTEDHQDVFISVEVS